MTQQQRIGVEFSHSISLQVMRLRIPSDRIVSTLSLTRDLGIDISAHGITNQDLLELIRAAKTELKYRGIEAAEKPVARGSYVPLAD